MKRGNRVVVDSSDEDSPSPNKATPPRRRLQQEREEEDSPLTPLSGSKRPLPAEHAARASLRRVLPLEDESEPQEAREQDEDDVVFSGEVTKQEKDAKALAEAVNLVSSEEEQEDGEEEDEVDGVCDVCYRAWGSDPQLVGCDTLERCLPLLTLRVFLRTARPALAGGQRAAHAPGVAARRAPPCP